MQQRTSSLEGCSIYRKTEGDGEENGSLKKKKFNYSFTS